ASVLHAYHVLLERAVDPEHIVTIMWDDVADSPNNPFPGKIFNTPDMSTDVYKGARIDYKGEDVTVNNILNVLAGNKDNVTGGNGRVIESTEKDRIFVCFLDHGEVGAFVVFQEDDVDFITAKALRDTLEDMYARKRYGQLTFYMESCFSGSMWNGTRDDINVYAVSSSSAEETSTAKYCPEDCDKHNDSLPCILEDCVGTSFGDNWMFDAEEHSIHETLEDEFGILVYKTETYTFNKTGRNQTASQFGDLSITGEPLALFLGRKRDTKLFEKDSVAMRIHKRHHPMAMWSFTDAPMKRLELQLRMASDIDDAKRALEGIHSLQK
ncbi:legumain 2, partial [Aphelenchoides avenae]